METFLLVVHLFIAIGLVSVVLLQRSEGGALGMGGGGPGGVMSGRAAGDLLTRTTQILAAAFFLTSVLLVVVHSVSGVDSVAGTEDIDEFRNADEPLFDDDLLEGIANPDAGEDEGVDPGVTLDPGFDLDDEFAVTGTGSSAEGEGEDASSASGEDAEADAPSGEADGEPDEEDPAPDGR